MILRQKSLRLSIVVGFLLLLAFLGNAKEITLRQTNFRHAPKRFFYFDDSSVILLFDSIDYRYYFTLSLGLFIVPMMTELLGLL